MTREEAIEQLQNCKDLIKQNGQDYLDERDFPLLDMAIEALHREEAEANGWCHRIRPKDVEVVVRCKDCKYYYSTEIATASIMCSHMHEDDFCNYGERREDERLDNES